MNAVQSDFGRNMKHESVDLTCFRLYNGGSGDGVGNCVGNVFSTHIGPLNIIQALFE